MSFRRPLRSKQDLVEALRERKEALNISHENLDGIVGWADHYSSKVLAPVPRKNLSGDMLQAVLDALGLGIAAVVLIEDPQQVARMQHRWQPRPPHGPRPVVRCSDVDCISNMRPTNAEAT